MPKDIRITVPSLEDVLPEEFLEHTLKAYKEFLIALRSLIDAQIKKIEEMEKEGRREIRRIQIE